MFQNAETFIHVDLVSDDFCVGVQSIGNQWHAHQRLNIRIFQFHVGISALLVTGTKRHSERGVIRLRPSDLRVMQ